MLHDHELECLLISSLHNGFDWIVVVAADVCGVSVGKCLLCSSSDSALRDSSGALLLLKVYEACNFEHKT